MKNIVLIFSLIFFTVLSSLPAHAEWTKINSFEGNDFYVDFEGIRKNKNFYYYWGLFDRLKPTTSLGVLSSKSLYELDCNIPLRERKLTRSWYSQPMGAGDVLDTSNTPESEWFYFQPYTQGANMARDICSR